MAFDFKKEYKEFYMPKSKPEIVQVPKANYIAVRGQGDPNEADGAYQQAIGVLYAVAYTLKMSYKTDHKMEGFFEYVVPPLEGFGQIRLPLDLRDPPAGFCDAKGFRLGRGNSVEKEKAGLLLCGISDRRRGALRTDHAPGAL